MVQIIEEQPSFGQIMARGGGQALGAFGSGLLEAHLQKAADKYKMKQFHEYMNPKKNQKASPEDIKKKFLDTAAHIEQQSGRELSPQDLDELWMAMQSPEMGQQLQGGRTANRPSNEGLSSSADMEETEDPDYFIKSKAAIASGLPKEMVDLFTKEGEAERKIGELPRHEYIKSEYKSLPKFMEGIEAAEDKIPMADVSIKLAEEAIEDPGKWAAFRDWLSDKTGYEGFRSGKGAELTSAIKQYFLGDLSSIKGGRPNQLIEQQLLDAYPRIGRDPISNQKILVGMKMQQDIAKEKVRVARDLEEKYLSEKGFLPPGFQSIVKKKLRPEVERIEKDTVNKLSSLSKFQKQYEKEAKSQLKQGEILMMSPSGEYEAIPKGRMEEAKNQGYIKLAG